MSMNWDCSLIMRTSLVQQNSQHKLNRYNRNQTSRDIYVFQKNTFKDPNRSVKTKGSEFQKSKQIKKKTSLKIQNSSSAKLLNSQNQIGQIKPNLSPYVNSLLVSPICQQTTRPQSKVQTDQFYSKVTQFYPEVLKSPKQNQYIQNNYQPPRAKGFCSPNLRPSKNTVVIPKNYPINQQSKVTSFCPKIPLFAPEHNKGGKIIIRQFNKLRPTKASSHMVSASNYNPHQFINKSDRNRIVKNNIGPLTYRNDINQSIRYINSQQNQENVHTINQTLKQSDVLSTLKSTRQPEGSRQVFKLRKRIEDFLKSKQQLRSIRDSDDISEEYSQILATHDQLLKDGVLRIDD